MPDIPRHIRSPHGRKITMRLGPTLDTLAALPKDPRFGLVFLRADKESYVNYYEAARRPAYIRTN